MAHLRTLIFLFVCCPLLVFSQEAKKEPPTPWSLSPGWWQELTESQPDEADKKVKELIQSLQSLDSQVAADSKELVRVALDAISKNINQYLQLRKLNGWVIEAAPAEKQSYTIDDLLNAAKQLKLDQATLQEASDDVKRLESVLVQAIQRVDELNVEYAATAGKSLQRTVAGLNVMVAVTGRAVVEQRLRVAREKQGGIEQRVSWSKAILASAKDRLDLSSIDSAALERDVASATGRETTLQAELLQIEADLLPTDAGGHVDTQLLRAVNKLISFAQAQIQIIMGRAKMALVTLAKGEESRVDGTALIENARSWIKDLDKLEKQEIEWKKLIRREQDAIERRLLGAGGEGTIPQDEGAEFLRRAIDTLSSLEHLEVERFQTSILAQQASALAMQQAHWFSCIWERTRLQIEGFCTGFVDVLFYPLLRISERPVSAFHLLRAIAIFFLVYLSSGFIRQSLRTLAKSKAHVSEASIYTFNRVTHYVLLLFGFLWALSSIGYDFSNLLIIMGALSVGIGFGLQGIVNNFLGGLIVLFDRKLRVGDFIELSNGEMGHLTEVNVQNTVIRTLTGHDILVPNSDILTRQLTNWTLRDPFARLHLPFGVAYGTDKEKVKQVVSEAALQLDETISGHKSLPDPTVWLVGFGESSLNFEMVVWVDLRRGKKRTSSIRAAYYWELESALRDNNIEIPFPQRDVHLKEERQRAEERT